MRPLSAEASTAPRFGMMSREPPAPLSMPPMPPAMPATAASGAPAPMVMPRASAAISPTPEAVRSESGPSRASLPGSRLRTLCITPLTLSMTHCTPAVMPAVRARISPNPAL